MRVRWLAPRPAEYRRVVSACTAPYPCTGRSCQAAQPPGVGGSRGGQGQREDRRGSLTPRIARQLRSASYALCFPAAGSGRDAGMAAGRRHQHTRVRTAGSGKAWCGWMRAVGPRVQDCPHRNANPRMGSLRPFPRSRISSPCAHCAQRYHLVGLEEEQRGHREPEGLPGRLQVDHQVELRGLLHRQVRRLRPLSACSARRSPHAGSSPSCSAHTPLGHRPRQTPVPGTSPGADAAPPTRPAGCGDLKTGRWESGRARPVCALVMASKGLRELVGTPDLQGVGAGARAGVLQPGSL